jgi:RecB family exonuclease
MRAIETCPLRWALSRAMYPKIWSRNGYPDRLYTGTVVGQVVHQALERITNELGAQAGAGQKPSVVGVMRALGGYSVIIARESERVAESALANPRVANGYRDLGEELNQRLPAMRLQLQMFVRNGLCTSNDLTLVSRSKIAGKDSKRGVLPGLNAEVDLRDAGGVWRGTADLIHVQEGGVEIVDFKTGVAKEEHELQLRLYARLFVEDRSANPTGLPVTRLTLIYRQGEVDVQVPVDAEMRALARDVDARAAVAQKEVSVMPPMARPSPEACGFCPVRQLCPEYWTPSGQALAGASTVRDGQVDAELRLHERTAHTTWKASTICCGSLVPGAHVLVRCPRENASLSSVLGEMVRGRILSAQLMPPTEESEDLPVLGLTKATEAFLLVSTRSGSVPVSHGTAGPST